MAEKRGYSICWDGSGRTGKWGPGDPCIYGDLTTLGAQIPDFEPFLAVFTDFAQNWSKTNGFPGVNGQNWP